MESFRGNSVKDCDIVYSPREGEQRKCAVLWLRHSANVKVDQRSTVGWKATKAAVRLVEEYMVRIETASSTNLHQAN